MDKHIKYILRIIMLIPISTVLQVPRLDFANKILFALLILYMAAFVLKNNSLKAVDWLLVLLLALDYAYIIAVDGVTRFNTNDMFYLPFLVIFGVFTKYNFEQVIDYFDEDNLFVKRVAAVWTAIVFFSVFIPSSWPIQWGGDRYFGSFCGSVFRLAPTALFIMGISAIYYSKERKPIYLLLCIMPMFCFFMGGSRTYLGVGILAFLLVWIMFCKTIDKIYLSIVPLAAVLLFVASISTIGDKIDSTAYSANSYFDYLGTITNGRSVFWDADIEAYLESGSGGILLGSGFNFVYEVNQRVMGDAIWAHNDFINILMTYGLVGLMVYINSISNLFSVGSKKAALSFLILCIYFINASFNMFYTYFCSVLAMPLFVVAVNHYVLHSDSVEVADMKATYVRRGLSR